VNRRVLPFLLCAVVASSIGAVGFIFGQRLEERRQEKIGSSAPTSFANAHRKSAMAEIFALKQLRAGDIASAIATLDYQLDFDILGLSPNYMPKHQDQGRVFCELGVIRRFRLMFPSRANHDRLYSLQQQVLQSFPVASDGDMNSLCMTSSL
jgi:hypothetical protein